MIKNIIFDFGCVLVDLDKQRCVNAFKSIGAENISSYVDECRQEDLFHDLEIGNIGINEFCDAVRRKAPECKATNGEICEAWNMLLTGIPQRRIETLLRLKDGYRLFLLSNTNPIHWEMSVRKFFPYQKLTVEDYFEKIFLSYRMHKIKPNAEIFLEALEEAGIEAADTMFIDDSEANCKSAASVGMKTWHVKSGDEWVNLLLKG